MRTGASVHYRTLLIIWLTNRSSLLGHLTIAPEGHKHTWSPSRRVGGAMRSTWRLGKWLGIPIVLHWTVLLGLPWLYYQTRDVAATAISFVAFFFLLLAHELGHAAVARWRGIPVRRIQRFFIHGSCTHDAPYYEADDVLIAWGGVAAQFVVLVVAAAASVLMANASPVAPGVTGPLFRVLIQTNIFMMIFNLIPVAPLDGAKAWRALFMLREWAELSSWAGSVRKLFR